MVAIQVGRQFFREKEWQARHFVHTKVKEQFSESANRLIAGYGLRQFEPNFVQNNFKQKKNIGNGDVIILIHGLDEPGKIWMNLAPVLLENEFQVLIMTYPNDQSVMESAHFFCDQMVLFCSGKKKKVSIVGHSMGGLVAREMMTNQDISYWARVEKGEVPNVETLIMVGTPNHGSELARFRFFTEVRDQVSHLLKQDSHWLQGLVDGAGEAGIDLIPGSLFLTRLNSRPHPKHLNMQVIAGMVSPWSEDEIPIFIRNLEVNLPQETQQAARQATRALEKILVSMVRTIGDGLVSVDSARLEGVPLIIIRGTHLTMIRNISATSQRIPPAIPLILKMLTP
jgi:pimeloyl-ACP methyl ester carboxylesterase